MHFNSQIISSIYIYSMRLYLIQYINQYILFVIIAQKFLEARKICINIRKALSLKSSLIPFLKFSSG